MKTLMLDLDGKNGLNVFLRRRWVMKYMGLKTADVRCSHTMNGWHLEIDLDNEIDDVKTIFMQAVLGSDYRREVCNLLRIERGCESWNNLFKRKYKVNELGELIQVSEEKPDPELSEKILKLLQLGE